MTEQASMALKFSPEELKERYRQERDKRLQLRPEGNEQYTGFSGAFADFDTDPYADPHFSRDPVAEDVDTAIIGAGLGGLMAAARLAQKGVTNVRIIDKAGDFGGTWYWNRYPGAACDTESYIYMPLLEETGYVPTEKYAKAYEIFEQCQRVAHHFDLYPKALFQTEVEEVRWDDDLARWLVTTNRGDRLSARFLIISGGILHKAKLPRIPGIETFKGRAFHTSRWDYGYTGGSPTEPMANLADKKVAIIGTGATAIQAVPKLAEAAQQLYVVQRTPSGVGRRDNQPTDPDWAKSLKPGWQQERMENFTRIVSGQPADRDLVDDGWTHIFRNNPNAFAITTDEDQMLDFESMEKIRGRVDEIVEDRETAEALKPWYYQLCKRPCFHDEYLPAFNRPNVRLLDTGGQGVERITENAIVINGESHPVDCIIFASGFEVGSSLKSRLGFEIYGCNGTSLTDAWAAQGGPSTLHGLLSRGFPNLMMFGTLQSGIAINFAHVLSEFAIHASWLISTCLERGIEQVEPTAEAEDAWFNMLLANMTQQARFLAECTPGYTNAEGRTDGGNIRGIPFFGGTMKYIDILREWRDAGDLAGLEARRQQAEAEAE